MQMTSRRIWVAAAVALGVALATAFALVARGGGHGAVAAQPRTFGGSACQEALAVLDGRTEPAIVVRAPPRKRARVEITIRPRALTEAESRAIARLRERVIASVGERALTVPLDFGRTTYRVPVAEDRAAAAKRAALFCAP